MKTWNLLSKIRIYCHVCYKNWYLKNLIRCSLRIWNYSAKALIYFFQDMSFITRIKMLKAFLRRMQNFFAISTLLKNVIYGTRWRRYLIIWRGWCKPFILARKSLLVCSLIYPTREYDIKYNIKHVVTSSSSKDVFPFLSFNVYWLQFVFGIHNDSNNSPTNSICFISFAVSCSK